MTVTGYCCNSSGCGSNSGALRVVRTIDDSHFADYADACRSALLNLQTTRLGGAGATAPPAISRHITSEGDVLHSASLAQGQQGDVVLKGTIGPIPYELHLSVSLDEATETVSVTLNVVKPLPVGPYTWKFKLGGVIRSSGKIVGAASLAAEADLPALKSPSWLCVLKCGGASILGILLTCLPSLAGGPEAYVACVVARAGSGAASIALCIAKECT